MGDIDGVGLSPGPSVSETGVAVDDMAVSVASGDVEWAGVMVGDSVAVNAVGEGLSDGEPDISVGLSPRLWVGSPDGSLGLSDAVDDGEGSDPGVDV